jgi:transposase
MVMTVSAVQPVAHLPFVLGLLRKLEVATLIDELLPPHPANVVSCGRGVEALVLAILDGDHALYKVGARLHERGMVTLLQEGLAPESLNDYRLGQIRDALFAANLNRLFGAVALKALAVYAIPTPWLHQDTTTLSLYGAYAASLPASAVEQQEQGAKETQGEKAPASPTREPATPLAPRPAYGHNKDGRPALKQIILSLGVSGDGGLPLRLGLRDGNTSDSTEIPVALEECLALGLEGVVGIVADSKAYSQQTLRGCFEKQIGLVTLVPRTCDIRQEVEAWGQQQVSLPLLVEKPGRTTGEPARCWRGQSVKRVVPVEDGEGHVVQKAVRFVAIHSSQLAQQHAHAYTKAQRQEAEALAAHRRQLQAQSFACLADAEAARLTEQGSAPGQRGRPLQRWRYHTVRYAVETFQQRGKRPQRGRPRPGEPPPEETRYRLVVEGEAVAPVAAAQGWFVLATTVDEAIASDTQILQAYQEQMTTVEPGFRWIKNPAAITPVWLEKPERIAALAMLTVVGLLVYSLIQRQVRLYLQAQQQTVPGNKGPTAVPTAAVVLALFATVTLVHVSVGQTVVTQVVGWQDAHGVICDALGITRSWYEPPPREKEHREGDTP